MLEFGVKSTRRAQKPQVTLNAAFRLGYKSRCCVL